MPQLRLDVAGQAGLPPACHLTMRAGNVIRRLAFREESAGADGKPASSVVVPVLPLGARAAESSPSGSCKARLAQVDLFQRLGEVEVDLEALKTDSRQTQRVTVPSSLERGQPVRLQLDAAFGKSEISSPQAAKKRKLAKKEKASSYAKRQGVEAKMQAAMGFLLRDQPEDPYLYLAQLLLEESAPATQADDPRKAAAKQGKGSKGSCDLALERISEASEPLSDNLKGLSSRMPDIQEQVPAKPVEVEASDAKNPDLAGKKEPSRSPSPMPSPQEAPAEAPQDPALPGVSLEYEASRDTAQHPEEVDPDTSKANRSGVSFDKKDVGGASAQPLEGREISQGSLDDAAAYPPKRGPDHQEADILPGTKEALRPSPAPAEKTDTKRDDADGAEQITKIHATQQQAGEPQAVREKLSKHTVESADEQLKDRNTAPVLDTTTEGCISTEDTASHARSERANIDGHRGHAPSDAPVCSPQKSEAGGKLCVTEPLAGGSAAADSIPMHEATSPATTAREHEATESHRPDALQQNVEEAPMQNTQDASDEGSCDLPQKFTESVNDSLQQASGAAVVTSGQLTGPRKQSETPETCADSQVKKASEEATGDTVSETVDDVTEKAQQALPTDAAHQPAATTLPPDAAVTPMDVEAGSAAPTQADTAAEGTEQGLVGDIVQPLPSQGAPVLLPPEKTSPTFTDVSADHVVDENDCPGPTVQIVVSIQETPNQQVSSSREAVIDATTQTDRSPKTRPSTAESAKQQTYDGSAEVENHRQPSAEAVSKPAELDAPLQMPSAESAQRSAEDSTSTTAEIRDDVSPEQHSEDKDNLAVQPAGLPEESSPSSTEPRVSAQVEESGPLQAELNAAQRDSRADGGQRSSDEVLPEGAEESPLLHQHPTQTSPQRSPEECSEAAAVTKAALPTQEEEQPREQQGTEVGSAQQSQVEAAEGTNAACPRQVQEQPREQHVTEDGSAQQPQGEATVQAPSISPAEGITANPKAEDEPMLPDLSKRHRDQDVTSSSCLPDTRPAEVGLASQESLLQSGSVADRSDASTDPGRITDTDVVSSQDAAATHLGQIQPTQKMADNAMPGQTEGKGGSAIADSISVPEGELTSSVDHCLAKPPATKADASEHEAAPAMHRQGDHVQVEQHRPLGSTAEGEAPEAVPLGTPSVLDAQSGEDNTSTQEQLHGDETSLAAGAGAEDMVPSGIFEAQGDANGNDTAVTHRLPEDMAVSLDGYRASEFPEETSVGDDNAGDEKSSVADSGADHLPAMVTVDADHDGAKEQGIPASGLELGTLGGETLSGSDVLQSGEAEDSLGDLSDWMKAAPSDSASSSSPTTLHRQDRSSRSSKSTELDPTRMKNAKLRRELLTKRNAKRSSKAPMTGASSSSVLPAKSDKSNKASSAPSTPEKRQLDDMAAEAGSSEKAARRSLEEPLSEELHAKLVSTSGDWAVRPSVASWLSPSPQSLPGATTSHCSSTMDGLQHRENAIPDQSMEVTDPACGYTR
eukprot:TRINITY_DN47010_c0_g1_i1.p1 TRINITY_DN47010_c0_g1~~TRINITY_DN47010_c0_g1_i1.p1  ORF type:complete len:1498 (+),score=335.99 TRINITY_DN47010_c0_g1_i1:131-4624(+)